NFAQGTPYEFAQKSLYTKDRTGEFMGPLIGIFGNLRGKHLLFMLSQSFRLLACDLRVYLVGKF
ncbi:MAG: hypothetical protein AMK69_09640, partial [Nitrospira bacterium SG8_3]